MVGKGQRESLPKRCSIVSGHLPAPGPKDASHRWAISAHPESANARGPMGKALLNRKCFVNNDFVGDSTTSPWHEAGHLAGLRSAAAFPIHEEGSVIGAFAMYAAEPWNFTDELLATPEQFALDLSFAACRTASGRDAEDAMNFAAAIYSVMDRDATKRVVEYRCDTPMRYAGSTSRSALSQRWPCP
ncbi:MAG: GAF domain-containing protein, partial [Rhodocyclaceae bacterium]